MKLGITPTEALSLKELVDLAKSKDSDFKFKVDYWLDTRKKSIDFDWLMPKLEKILTREFLIENAKKLLEQENGREDEQEKKAQEDSGN